MTLVGDLLPHLRVVTTTLGAPMSTPRDIHTSRYSTVSDADLARYRAKAQAAIDEAERTITDLERQLGHELPSAAYHRDQLAEIDAELSRRELPAAS